MYKYLGVWINSRLSFAYQVTSSADRLKAYYARNKKLIRTYFSPRSLIKIFNYYQKSRLVYGMSSDMINTQTVIRLRQNIVSLVKQILGISPRSNNNRIVLALAVSDLTSKLVLQLLKNLAKLKKFFGIETDIYDKTLRAIIGEVDFRRWKEEGYIKDMKDLENRLDIKDMNRYSSEIGVEVGNEFHKIIRKEWYRYYDRRDYYVLKYFCNIGFFREEICEYCGNAGSKIHYINECEHFIDKRRITMGSIRKNCWREEFEGMRLTCMIDSLYYRPSVTRKVREKEMKMIKEFAVRVYWRSQDDKQS
jgi:hypothetical protein